MAPFWHRFTHFHCCKVSKRALRFLGKPHKIQLFTDYSMIVATRPDPTVLPPSRIRLGEPCVANGLFSGFSVIIFSENIDFLCSFKIFVAILQPRHVYEFRSNRAHFKQNLHYKETDHIFIEYIYYFTTQQHLFSQIDVYFSQIYICYNNRIYTKHHYSWA